MEKKGEDNSCYIRTSDHKLQFCLVTEKSSNEVNVLIQFI